MRLSQGNLGQALSPLIKKGIFCHPLGVEHGDKRWEETDHKHSSISRPLPRKGPGCLAVFYYWIEMLSPSFTPAAERAAVSLLEATQGL